MRKTAILSLLVTLSVHAQISIESLMKEHRIPAVGVGIIRNGELREVKVHGGPYDTVFNVASLTKPVVAMLALTLASQGKWDLDEPLAKHWTDPDVANDPRALVMLFPKSKEGLIVLTNGDKGHQVYGKLVTESLTLGTELMKRAN